METPPEITKSTEKTSGNALLFIIPLVILIGFIAYIVFNLRQSSESAINMSVNTSDWKIKNDDADKFSFKYPETLNADYTSLVDWPPSIQVLNHEIECTEAGSLIASGGKTEKRSVNGMDYCVTEERQGAAGSVYSNFAYAFVKGSETIILTFSIRQVQCLNYDEPNQSACKKEQSDFAVNNTMDKIIDAIARSISPI